MKLYFEVETTVLNLKNEYEVIYYSLQRVYDSENAYKLYHDEIEFCGDCDNHCYIKLTERDSDSDYQKLITQAELHIKNVD